MSTETFPSNQMDTWSDLRRDKETICMEVGNKIFHKKKIILMPWSQWLQTQIKRKGEITGNMFFLLEIENLPGLHR